MKYENLDECTKICKEITYCKEMLDKLNLRNKHIRINDRNHYLIIEIDSREDNVPAALAKTFQDSLYAHFQDRILQLEDQLKPL